MAPSFYNKIKRIHFYKFPGRMALEEFLRLRCTITRHPEDTVKRKDFYRAYRKFCIERNYTIASVVNAGRLLGRRRIWATTRVGGRNGKNQEYAYVGLSLRAQTPRRRTKIRKVVGGERKEGSAGINSPSNTHKNTRTKLRQKADFNEAFTSVMQDPVDLCKYTYDGRLNTINRTDLDAIGFQAVSPDEILKENIGERKHEPSKTSGYSSDSSYSEIDLQDPLVIDTYSITKKQKEPITRNMSPSPNSPLILLSSPTSNHHEEDISPKPSCSSSTKKQTASSSRENLVRLFDSFLKAHIRHTGSREDALPLEEVHESYRQWCLVRDIKPPRYDTMMVHLAPRVGVPVNYMSFEVNKEAYVGVQWSNLPSTILHPSKKVDPMRPCVNCQMQYYPGSAWQYNNKQGRYLNPWSTDDRYTSPSYQEQPLAYSNLLGSSSHSSPDNNMLHPIHLQTAANYQQVNSPRRMLFVPSPPNTQINNLYQMIDDFVTEDPHAF